MKFSEQTINDFMSRGDFKSVVRVFRSLQREVDTKDELFQEYMKDMSNFHAAFKKLEEQRDGLKRLKAAFKELCLEKGLATEVAAIEKSLGKPGKDEVEDLTIVEETGEPEELQPE